MTIHRFYYPKTLPREGTVTLPSTESAHAIKVLRLKPGDELLLMDGKGAVAHAILQAPPGNRRMHEAVCAIDSVTVTPRPTRYVHLYVAPPKSKNYDLVLKSATELGVSRITPILCRYGVAKPDGIGQDTYDNPLIAALKQSANPWLPELEAVTGVAEAVERSGPFGYFGAVPRAGEALPESPWDRPEGETSLWIGPEGGFAPEEEEMLRGHGLRPLTVGDWILRVETAVPALLACLNVRLNQ